MKRYQEIEFETECKRRSTAIKRLSERHPALYDVWGTHIEYMLDNGIECDDGRDAGYVLHVIEEDGYYYFCLIALNEAQIIA